ncbi:MAG: signal peptidase I [Candidatus Limnocylindrales bacterium]
MTKSGWAAISGRILTLLLGALIGILLVLLVVARIMPVAGWPTFVVRGGSMEPAIPIGALVVDRPVEPGQLRVGDVVSIQVGPLRAIFTHRIDRIVAHDGAIWIETKGDANRAADPALVPATAVVGRTAVVLPLFGYLLAVFTGVSGAALGVGLLGSLALARLLAATFAAQPAPAREREAGAREQSGLRP